MPCNFDGPSFSAPPAIFLFVGLIFTQLLYIVILCEHNSLVRVYIVLSVTV